MKTPKGLSFQIVDYRDFYDIPRLILAKDALESFWVFESRFSDELDEYEDCYRVFGLGTDKHLARSFFESHAGGDVGTLPDDVLSVGELVFDETRRKEFRVDDEIAGRITP